MGTKIKKSKYYINIDNYKNDEGFYEELTILLAQEKIAELMEKQKISKAKLAKSLNKSKAHVTQLLSDDHNLTLKTFGKLCFHLNTKIENFETSSININKIYEQIQKNKVSTQPYKKNKIIEQTNDNKSLPPNFSHVLHQPYKSYSIDKNKNDFLINKISSNVA